MKCLFLSAKRYSICRSLFKGLEVNSIETLSVDYEEYFPDFVNAFIRKYDFLPNRIKDTWKRKYIRKTNNFYEAIFIDFKPDIVLIYNNQNIQPTVLDYFKKKSKIVFLLGDNPLYTPTNIYNLHLLFSADYIICPDTFWVDQLKRIGIKNAVFDCFGIDEDKCFKFTPTAYQKELFGSDLVYVGSAQVSSWGYKRFLFLSQFKDLNIKAFISGKGYDNYWNSFFPELRSKIIPHDRYDPFFNNVVYNCSKIYPIETVPSIFNGVHMRILEALGAGILPLCEYTSDLDIVFSGINFPTIRSFSEASGLATYYINNNVERETIIQKMKKRVEENYSPKLVIKRMLDVIFS